MNKKIAISIGIVILLLIIGIASATTTTTTTTKKTTTIDTIKNIIETRLTTPINTLGLGDASLLLLAIIIVIIFTIINSVFG